MDPTINSFPSFHYNYRTYSRAGFRIAQNLLSASAFFSASSYAGVSVSWKGWTLTQKFDFEKFLANFGILEQKIRKNGG